MLVFGRDVGCGGGGGGGGGIYKLKLVKGIDGCDLNKEVDDDVETLFIVEEDCEKEIEETEEEED